MRRGNGYAWRDTDTRMIIFPGAVIGRPKPTLIWTESAANGAASSPETFAGISLSTENSTRQIFVAVYGGATSAVTVGGVSASFIETAASDTLTLWRAAVPTGTSASVVVTFTGGGGRQLISVWAAYNLQSTTAIDTASYASSSTPATDHTTTIDTVDNGILIGAAATVVNAGDGGPSWVGASLSNNRILSAGAIDFVLSAGDADETSVATGATLRTTWSPAIGSVAMVGASFR